MKILKFFFPLSVMAKEKNKSTLWLTILLYAALILIYFFAAAFVGVLSGDLVAWLLGLLGIFVGMYCTIGIVLSILSYHGIIK